MSNFLMLLFGNPAARIFSDVTLNLWWLSILITFIAKYYLFYKPEQNVSYSNFWSNLKTTPFGQLYKKTVQIMSHLPSLHGVWVQRFLCLCQCSKSFSVSVWCVRVQCLRVQCVSVSISVSSVSMFSVSVLVCQCPVCQF